MIFSQNGMIQAEKEKKKYQSRIPLMIDPGKKIPKKIGKKFKKLKKKNYFRQYLQPKRDEIGREREKKILGPNSAHTGPRQENSEKITKKFKKLKNLFPA